MINKCIVEWCDWVWCKNWRWWRSFPLWYCSKHYRRFKRYWSVEDSITSHIKIWQTKHYLYQMFQWIKSRCYKKTHDYYKNYWWRWIKVCDRRLWPEWFSNFINDMWERPKWCSIDRIDNNWNYEPWNCRWATSIEQWSNTSRTTILWWMNVRELSSITWYSSKTIHRRIKKWWSLERIISKSK